MAVTINGVRFLVRACAAKAVLGSALTIGRQGLYAPLPLVRKLLAEAAAPIDALCDDLTRRESSRWADDVIRALGASRVDTLDASPYEGATILHDLNQQIPDTLVETYDTLIDAGSLEHVFDVKTAIENYLRIPAVGGQVILLDMPAVNFCGHGFYQFSPELFCEVFSAKHGFELLDLVVCEDAPFAKFHRVDRPREVKRRIEIFHDRPCHLFVRARKIASFPGFVSSVIQSDYEEAWQSTGEKVVSESPRGGGVEWLRRFWRRVNLRSYWRFTNHRNQQRKMTSSRLDAGKVE